MKPKEIITQSIRNKPQECDLAFDFQAKVAIFDLRNGEAGLRQERWQGNAGLVGARIGKAGNAACSTGHHGELLVAGPARPGHDMFCSVHGLCNESGSQSQFFGAV